MALCIGCCLDFEMWALHSKVEANERKLVVDLTGLNDWGRPAYVTRAKSVGSFHVNSTRGHQLKCLIL